MNPMQILSSQPWVERLGWILVHFLWQGLFIGILYAVVRRAAARASSPNTRYLLACAALAAMMVAPLLTWSALRPTSGSPDAAYRIRSSPPPASSVGIAETSTLRDAVRARSSEVFPIVVTIWLAGAAIFWVRLAGGWFVAARMRSVSVRRAPQEWQEILRKLGVQIGLSRPVRLLISALVQVPTVVGWLRPVVLVPVGALTGLPAAHLEALLLHELAHIRRHDYLVNMLQSVAEALLFYHPAVWWVSGHIRAERELCCDDVAVSVTGDPLMYAGALAELESYRPAHLRAAVAANGGTLSGRIARLLGQPQPAVRSCLGPGVLAVAILLVLASFGLFGQATFQSVSIKRNTSDWSERFRHPMGMGVNSSLLLLIQFAYAPHDNPMLGHSLPLPASQIIGGPDWINSEGYDIQVNPAVNRDPQQTWVMWRKLLADRFQLRLHRETRELPAYELTRAASGLKLPPAKEAGCVSFPPGTQPHHVPGKVDCGYVSGPFSEGAAGVSHIKGSKVHIADLVRELALILDRPILDKTGFTGEFDLDLSFSSNTNTALEDQLGLKLVPVKAPIDVLVIDHAERPAAN